MITATLLGGDGLTVVDFDPDVDDLDEAVRRLQVQALLDGTPGPAPTQEVLVAVNGCCLGTARLGDWGGYVYTPAAGPADRECRKGP